VGDDLESILNPNSLEVLGDCFVEPELTKAQLETRSNSSGQDISVLTLTAKPSKLVFNRTVSLRDAWAKLEQKNG